MALNTPQTLVRSRSSSFNGSLEPKILRPFDAGEIKILLLENINQIAVELLTKEGYQASNVNYYLHVENFLYLFIAKSNDVINNCSIQVEQHANALSEAELIEKIREAHAVGIRSKTKMTKKVLLEAKKLLVIGCFCIGTNQVDLETAAKQGISVFNSPFSNSRSVAELVIAEIIGLSRQLGDRNNEMHRGDWNKVSSKCYEIRGKKLGIIGYGHIGAQLSVLAEAMGMTVYFHDIIQIMPLGSAKQLGSLYELLECVDFVTIHVPETRETKNMIGDSEIKIMKPGSYLINASRGTVVQIPAVIKALKNKHLAGAALDVFPRGSTEEAQRMIGIEVAGFLTKYINNGTSIGAVNFPEVDLRAIPAATQNSCRLLFAHKNVPGVLKINDILSDHNVEKQFSDSRGEIAYLMADISNVTYEEIRKIYEYVSATKANILTRIVY
ncbi:5080_t:CDS:2 [Ambispora leptoticha]|uniref:5080_t:CDS:1 n=1 Tax=Ambispora leptoticha TaxID=144679 RepID=A0A9N8YR05_9GLOM|nr:5080_t:CDS:2 [Ambispora leptoticha]